MPEPRRTHSERLTAPAGLWLLAIVFASTLVIAVGLYLTAWYGLATALVCALVLGVVLGGWGSAVVAVDERGLRAGRQLVEWPWVSRIEVLDAQAMRREMGPGALATAFLFTRPYIAGGVKVVLDDPADPHPCWIVSSRHPEQLVAAADAQLLEQRDDSIVAAGPRVAGMAAGPRVAGMAAGPRVAGMAAGSRVAGAAACLR